MEVTSKGSNMEQHITQGPTSGMQKLDQNLASASSCRSNMMKRNQILLSGGSHENNVQHQSPASGSSYVTMTRGHNDCGIIEPEAPGSSTFAPDDQIL